MIINYKDKLFLEEFLQKSSDSIEMLIICKLFVATGEFLHENIKYGAFKTIISVMEKMGILDQKYFNMSRSHIYILDELKKRILTEIQDELSRFNIEDLQQVCMKAANILSECSVAIFEPDRIYPDVSLIKTINIISEKTNEDPKGAETQERSSYLKQSLNLLYSQTENLNCNQGLKKVEFDEFSKLLTFECSLIIILELRSALSSKLINIVEFNIKPLGIYSVELEKSSKVMENMLGLNEKLYAKNEDKIMKIFKSEHGFDDESIISLLNLFDGTVTMFSKTKSEMKELLQSKLRLDKKQLDFFMNIMFFDTQGIKGNISKVIKNVNCSIFSTPFVQNINGNVMVNKANLIEASMYLRRRIMNEDISDRGVHPLVKKLRNEKVLPILQKNLKDAGIDSTINKNLEEIKDLKQLLQNQKGFPHELDLYYVENGTLKIFDLKNYMIPLSIKDVARVKKSIAKEVTKLFKLNNFIENNKQIVKNSLKSNFDTIKYGILITNNYSPFTSYKGVQIITVSKYLNNL
ncbi:hypothetical protein CBG05_03350 [Limosilactobacillus reuteri]|uniref:hypothetical protein n=1 Tax=Limosilactobacillus reuteri TaxID=1598 RepID=UPI000B9840B2|nr:hypothetical protein [Limosilactobacillus reuteri]OYS79450.1 hypothetical protein CBG05_03350 [Limosilactobacillus reuteri]